MRWLLCLVVVACGSKPPAPAPAAGPSAYVAGGVPRYDDTLGAALAALPAVPDDTAWPSFRGTVIADDLPKLWAAALRWQAGETLTEPVNDLAVALDAKLRDANLGYFVHAQLDTSDDGRRATLRTFRVRDLTIATAGADRYIVYALEPIGATVTPESAGQTFRGMPLVHTRAATVDAVNMIAMLSTKRVVDFEEPKLDVPLTQHVLDEVRGMVGDADRAVQIGELLASWQQQRGATYLDVENEPTGPMPPGLDIIERELEKHKARPLIDALDRRILRRTKLHELQHAIDYKAERFEQGFAPISALIPDESIPTQLLAMMETSAWTATFARDWSWYDFALGVGIAHLDHVPTGYAFAFLSDALVRKFDAQAKPALHDGVIDRDLVRAHATILVQHDARELSAAARALWESWFGVPLATIDLSDVRP